MTDANLTAHAEMKSLLTIQYDRALKAMNALADELVGNLIAEWEAKGGCKVCEGTQRVLTWWTLDGGSYDEFGPCQSCTDASRAIGTKPGVWGPRGSNSRNGLTTLELAKKEFGPQMQDAVDAYSHAKSNYTECIERQLDKQEYIIVVKGRKVPIGDHGVIVGFSNNQWGSKVGFVNAQGKIQWTAITNVERCLGMDGATKQGAIEEYIKSTNEFRAKKGLPASNITVEMLLNKC